LLEKVRIMSEKIQILEIRSELGAGTRGASLGTGAIKVASLKVGDPYFAQYPLHLVPNENELLFRPTQTTRHAKYIKGILKVYNYVAEAMDELLHERTEFIVILSGDHSSAGASISGLKTAFPEKRLGVIWVDAHADMHTPYTTPSGNLHGMPLALSLGFDNLDKRRNDPSPEVSMYWNQLKYVGNIAPKIYPEDLVFIALRDTEDEEDFLIDQHEVKTFRVKDVNERGAVKIAEETLDYLKNCDMLYISFDVDSMDCNLVSKGTGTPVPDGLSVSQAEELLCRLAADERLTCMEVTEVNPLLDEKCNLMAETAFQVLRKVTDVVETRLRKK
jgi:arginase